MSAPEIKGWCPGVLRPMMSGDGLVVRVRPRGGRLTPDHAKGLAELSQRHGNGLIDLSARANIQLRGVTEAGHGPLIEGLSALGLIDETTEVEARRNIVVTPFWREGDGTQEIAAALASELAKPDAPEVPGKFGYCVDIAKPPVLRGTSADIRIEWHPDGFLVRGESFVTGAMVKTPDEAAKAATQLADWFVAKGGVGPDGRGRMARLWSDMPLEARQEKLPARFQEGGAGSYGAPGQAPGSVPLGFLAAFAFGQCDAETLSNLAEIAPLRITPWRMLLVEGLRTAPDLPGLITDPADPRLKVTACTGAPGCPQGLAPTRPLAAALAAAVPKDATLHVSGCAKGCAHPGPAPLVLVARAGGRFDLVRQGRACDSPALTGLDSAALAARPDILTESPDAP